MSHEAISTPAEFALKDFAGTYIGIAPSDGSAVGMAEIEITIDELGVTTRYATGLGITDIFTQTSETHETDLATVIPPIDDEERAFALEQGVDMDVTRVFKVEHLDFAFFKITNPELKAPVLHVMGSMGDMLGPTLLFSPEQVEAGMHEEIIADIEQELGKPGDLPRLANDGYAPNYHPEPNL